MNPSFDTSSWSALRDLLLSLGFDTLPAFSEVLRGSLREELQGLHASLDLEEAPDNLPGWADLLRSESAGAAVCGLAGYGLESVFFALHWRQGPVILLSRTHFGALGDAARDASRASGLIALANALMLRAGELEAAGLWPENRLLLVVDDEFDSTGWCWSNEADLLDSYQLDSSLGLAGAFAALDALSGPTGTEAAS